MAAPKAPTRRWWIGSESPAGRRCRAAPRPGRRCPARGSVGTSPRRRPALGAALRKGTEAAVAQPREPFAHVEGAHVEVAAEQRGLHRRGPRIGHVHEADARRRLFEVQLQQVVVGADARCAERHRLRRPARRRQQVFQAAIGGVGSHPEAARVVDDVGDVAELRHAVAHPPLDGDGHQGGRGDGAERVAVRASVEGGLGADLPACASAVVNHELRPGSCRSTCGSSSRAIWSTPPPGGKGTTTWIGRSQGHSAARARGGAARTDAPEAARPRRVMCKVGTRSVGQCPIGADEWPSPVCLGEGAPPSSPAPAAPRSAAAGLDRGARPRAGHRCHRRQNLPHAAARGCDQVGHCPSGLIQAFTGDGHRVLLSCSARVRPPL